MIFRAVPIRAFNFIWGLFLVLYPIQRTKSNGEGYFICKERMKLGRLGCTGEGMEECRGKVGRSEEGRQPERSDSSRRVQRAAGASGRT